MGRKAQTKKLVSDLYIVTKAVVPEDMPRDWQTWNRGRRNDFLTKRYRDLADAIQKRFSAVQVVAVESIALFVRFPVGKANEFKQKIETEFGCKVFEDAPLKLIEPVRERPKKS